CSLPASAAITLSAVAARTSGVAPLAVFFDATASTALATTRPFHELEYRWDFGDPGSGTWANGSRAGTSSRNFASGPVAAHVFETPGTYTVCVSASDGTNIVGQSITVTVTDPDVVFAGANTICFSTSNTFTSAPCTAPGTVKFTTSDLPTALAQAAPGKRLLFRRGETWTAGSNGAITKNGPGIVGAFGVGAKPIFRATADVDLVHLSNLGVTIADWRIVDIELNGNANTQSAGVTVAGSGGNANQVTLLRLAIHDVNYGIRFADDLAPYNQTAIVDSTISNLIGVNPPSLPYGIY